MDRLSKEEILTRIDELRSRMSHSCGDEGAYRGCVPELLRLQSDLVELYGEELDEMNKESGPDQDKKKRGAPYKSGSYWDRVRRKKRRKKGAL